MNEMIYNGIESVAATEALIGAAAGYAVGQILESRALKSIEENRKAFMMGHEDAGDKNAYRQSRLMRTVASLAVLGTFSGYSAGQAIRSHDTTLETRPTVEVAVDHSFEVSEEKYGGNGSVKMIDSIASKILENENFEATAYLAHGETSKNVKTIAELKKDGKGDNPTGSPSLVNPTRAALDGAYGKASIVESSSLSSNPDRNAAVLVLTDGNTIGMPKVVVANAKSKGDIPIFIADTGSSSKTSDIKNAEQLKAIAQQTGGKYWHVAKNTKDIEATITEALSPKAIEVSNDGERFAWGLMSLLSAAEMIRRFKTRSRQLGDEEPVNS